MPIRTILNHFNKMLCVPITITSSILHLHINDTALHFWPKYTTNNKAWYILFKCLYWHFEYILKYRCRISFTKTWQWPWALIWNCIMFCCINWYTILDTYFKKNYINYPSKYPNILKRLPFKNSELTLSTNNHKLQESILPPKESTC